MAKFRRNYSQDRKGGTSTYVRAALFAGVLILLMSSLYTSIDHGMNWFKSDTTAPLLDYQIPKDAKGYERLYMPYISDQDSAKVVHHTYYSLSYEEAHEQASWVSYELTKEMLLQPNVSRTDFFAPDPMVMTGSAVHKDYSGSGYTRGHLAPAGDMAHDIRAMEESFYMSNMSPQLRVFNNGIWRELEEQVRDWAIDNERLFITTGPILSDVQNRKIGRNKVSIPNQFYKVIADINEPDVKMIGFLIPNELSDQPLHDYAVSIDVIEAKTGINFFAHLLPLEQSDLVESKIDITKWKVDQNRFQQRVQHWNLQK